MVVTQKYHDLANKPPPVFPMLACRKGGVIAGFYSSSSNVIADETLNKNEAILSPIAACNKLIRVITDHVWVWSQTNLTSISNT